MSCARQRECRWHCVCILRGRLRRQACLGSGFGMGVGEQGGEDFLSVPFKGAAQRRQAGLAKVLRSCGHALRAFVSAFGCVAWGVVLASNLDGQVCKVSALPRGVFVAAELL